MLKLPKGSIVIDCASSCNLFGNDDLLSDVKRTSKKMILYGNGGDITNDRMGVYDGAYVWYNPKFIANILSLSLISKSKRVIMDTSVSRSIKVEWSKDD